MRDLNKVISAMLNEIPDKDGTQALCTALEKHQEDNLYTAPEAADWGTVGTILMVNMGRFAAGDVWCEDWCEKVLKIWRDEK